MSHVSDKTTTEPPEQRPHSHPPQRSHTSFGSFLICAMEVLAEECRTARAALMEERLLTQESALARQLANREARCKRTIAALMACPDAEAMEAVVRKLIAR